jgi:hypothetical protein
MIPPPPTGEPGPKDRTSMDQPTGHPPLPPSDGGSPPFLGSWNRLYAAVLVWLAALILFFYAFTVIFS